jgi:hypothetical protein
LGSIGPSTCLSRVPWPWSPMGPPIGQLGAPHFGQRLGRTASTDGKLACQLLISMSLWIMVTPLRVLSFGLTGSEHDEEGWLFQDKPSLSPIWLASCWCPVLHVPRRTQCALPGKTFGVAFFPELTGTHQFSIFPGPPRSTWSMTSGSSHLIHRKDNI